MKHWWVLLLTLLLILPATAALAGRGGNLQLSRGYLEVAEGKVPIYLQALQHGVYPVDDAQITVKAVRPDGQTLTWTGALDPTYGNDNVYLVWARFDQPGDWKLTFEAKSRILFAGYERTIRVLPAGSKVRPLGDITMVERGHFPSGAPGPVQRPALEPEYDQPLGARIVTPALAGGGVILAGAAALLAWRKRRNTVR
ncbi:MAG TPA: hypothetical protein VK464_25035 [Symbiobacteriaceae bacterium]|nr:hypothetical protein [Symbiobacteriaceae bacterium]